MKYIITMAVVCSMLFMSCETGYTEKPEENQIVLSEPVVPIAHGYLQDLPAVWAWNEEQAKNNE